jgi:hypothetical protein
VSLYRKAQYRKLGTGIEVEAGSKSDMRSKVLTLYDGWCRWYCFLLDLLAFDSFGAV